MEVDPDLGDVTSPYDVKTPLFLTVVGEIVG
jgi:hypothetical protein